MPLSLQDESALREKHSIPSDKKVVLLAGGGEGLPNAVRIVQHFVRRKVPFTIVVVCGKDEATKKSLSLRRSFIRRLICVRWALFRIWTK